MKNRTKNRVQPEEKPKDPFNWDVLIKSIGAIVGVAGLIFGIYQYSQKKTEENQKNVEAKKALQREKYLKILDITTEFTQASERQTADDAKSKFWKMYEGELSLVEDENVKQMMMKYGGAMKQWEKYNAGSSDFSAPLKFEFEDVNGEPLTFSELNYQLSQACKQSLVQ